MDYAQRECWIIRDKRYTSQHLTKQILGTLRIEWWANLENPEYELKDNGSKLGEKRSLAG